jgi:hypothetical protein
MRAASASFTTLTIELTFAEHVFADRLRPLSFEAIHRAKRFKVAFLEA